MDDVGSAPGDGRGGIPEVPGAGTLVIQTWQDYGEQPPGFRARITYGPMISDERITVSAADRDKILHVVQQWLLTQFAAQSRN